MEEYLRCYAEIDLSAVAHNIDEVRKKVGSGVGILAVVKADGYGHGALPVAKCLKDKVQYFAVATVEEAVELRCEGVTLPILILGYVSPKQYEEVVRYDITQTIYSVDTAKKLGEEALRQKKRAKIHIAVDTGMTRIGFSVKEESIEEIMQIGRLPGIYLEGMFSHFSCADMTDKAYTKMQMERYDWFVAELEQRKISIPMKHLCNSAGIIEFDSHRFNMVRSGIMTYGMYPSDEVNKEEIRLKPALCWKTHVVNVNCVEAGHGVSYGATYVTDRPTKIATLSVGYADGYPRALSNKGRVIIHGKYAPVIGRVCMDQTMVDVTHIDDVKIEDTAILVGSEGGCHIPVEEAAELAGSFNYEFVCGISRRVKRIY
ncbi:MAG: alanine racemase [Alistipes sp.]|nr:alanine racemase [Alistipes sp.]